VRVFGFGDIAAAACGREDRGMHGAFPRHATFLYHVNDQKQTDHAVDDRHPLIESPKPVFASELFFHRLRHWFFDAPPDRPETGKHHASEN
jgi:hypothetical protein